MDNIFDLDEAKHRILAGFTSEELAKLADLNHITKDDIDKVSLISPSKAIPVELTYSQKYLS
ncbi:hypothetical protein [Endozoicomonas lisbonensis]|uniref:Uncharacterized protein n=1 Tax=Endozoicomonas lisbonensis TaxID=3120522 RepID=A0ABV2SB40_9GAMM